MENKIRVLIVDDSMFFREYLAEGLTDQPDIEIAGFAKDPYEARDKILEIQPDVITLDVNMPKMSGIDFLKKLLPQYPIPIVVISSASTNIFDALNAGAVDFLKKPDLKDKDGSMFFKELVVKIRISSEIKYINVRPEEPRQPVKSSVNMKNADKYVIAMGASTGGTEALFEVIQRLPADLPGIVIVQHMPPVFTKMYADRLNQQTGFEVKEAEDRDEVRKGRIIIAQGGIQMRIATKNDGYYVRLSGNEKQSGHCPSVDILFDSVAETAKENSIGVLLTGMGVDGAKGLLNMKKNGAFTIGQDEASSVVYGMPKAAFSIGAVTVQLPLLEIPSRIVSCFKNI
ncbi:MAG: chemotaxis response regulator protein-glutamate methylesterase [Clostridia bacterium]|jgi:two-component system chemotaxis response regulator CheB